VDCWVRVVGEHARRVTKYADDPDISVKNAQTPVNLANQTPTPRGSQAGLLVVLHFTAQILRLTLHAL
jgi:hypothetical protein